MIPARFEAGEGSLVVIQSVALSWMLTAVFAVAGVYWVGRGVLSWTRTGANGWEEGSTDVAHVLMCLGMIAMLWPWGHLVPRWPQVAVFVVAAAWFLVRAFLPGRWAHSRGRGECAHHVVAMGAMAWMIALMMGARHDTASMPGMAMPQNIALPLYAVVANRVLAVCFVLMTVWWLAGAVDLRRTPAVAGAGRGSNSASPIIEVVLSPKVNVACHGLMSAGMAIMLVATP